MKLNVPNPGFYESIFSAILDSECEQETDYLQEYEGMSRADAEDAAIARIWSEETQKNIARAYVALFQNWIKEDLGVEVDLTFCRIISPAYYNFTSDKIQVELSDEDARALYNALICRYEVREAIKYAGTPRSGYLPFVSPNWQDEDWHFEHMHPASWEVLLTPLYNHSYDERFYDIEDAVQYAIN